MRYFTARGETATLTPFERMSQPGSFAELSHGRTHFQVSGPENGPLVALLPGLTVPLQAWDATVDALHARGLRTLTYSAYGRGYSDRPDTVYDRALFVGQLEELLAHVDEECPHLVASSMGALIALGYLSRGGHATSLTLSGPAGLGSKTNLAAKMPRSGPLPVFLGRYLLRGVLTKHLDRNANDPRDLAPLRELVLEAFRFSGSMFALLSTLQNMEMTRQDSLFDAGRHALPRTQLLWGDDDRVTPVTDFSRAVELLRPIRSERIPGCGHMAPLERPELFVDRVASFVLASDQR